MNLWNPFEFGEFFVQGAKNKANQVVIDILKDIALSSYWICLIGGLIGLVLYLFGCKKGKNAATIAPAIYLIIRILSSVLLNV